ncbi:faa53472-bf1a-4a23-8ee1-59bb4655f746 [Thermothielavioides terrestris]|uniref:Faa53472-bf1a-4a23-8ee1-59bb4655f746 n=1 Tax=Thermothielavioides terrestris TaxID=2587410 RepID=A0A3S5CXV7_9PEZI|nr:faa53472-bf1a-4a23-8ee1-59bb4655f746 [Thermothielavioides terrestris]
MQWRRPGAATEANASFTEVPVELGPVSDRAARWWAAILAPNQGWTAGINADCNVFLAPWSTTLVQTGKASTFVLSGAYEPAEPAIEQQLPPSFSVAASYIAAYAAHHGAQDQSRVAFAAALMLPSTARITRTIRLLAPCPRQAFSDEGNISSANPGPAAPVWGDDVHQLDRLLTLSCNNFLQALLSSVAFEPDIPCNACGAWIQGTFAVLDSDHVKADLQVLTGALMARNPKLGFLWVGAAALGIHSFYLFDCMRTLFYPIDLTLAGWTNTLMSFIQQPARAIQPTQDKIRGADEARLLFLSQAIDHTEFPIKGFPPFGSTAIADCGLEVQRHVSCGKSHQLYYSTWTWDCRDGERETVSYEPPKLLGGESVLRQDDGETAEAEDSCIQVDYSRMDRELDCAEVVTRCIIGWLREHDGFPIAERGIREHEWIDFLYESEDDEPANPEGDWKSVDRRRKAHNIGPWIARTVTHRRHSFH